MSLSRKFLAALGIEPEKIEEIVTAHTETVEGLKEEISKYKADATELPAVKKELEDLKDAAEKAGANGSAYQVKYEALKEEFDAYKADVEAKAVKASKEKAYRELLKEAGVSEKRIDAIMKVSAEDIDKLNLDADGKAKDAKEIVKSISDEWADFVVKETITGAPTAKPPGNNRGASMTKEEIMAIKDTAQRQQAMLENKQLFI